MTHKNSYSLLDLWDLRTELVHCINQEINHFDETNATNKAWVKVLYNACTDGIKMRFIV